MGRVCGVATFAAVFAGHAALILLLRIGPRAESWTAGPETVVAPVYLADLGPKRLPRLEARGAAASPPAAPGDPVEPPAGQPLPQGAGAQTVAAPAGDGEAEAVAVARALRGSRIGCANPSLLSDQERELCEDRLAQGADLAKHIPTPIPAERRAFYDAVVKAKAPPKPTTPGPDPVRSAQLGYKPDPEQRGRFGALPGLGCKLTFGGPKGTGGWTKPGHSLQLGPLPCFLMPPRGSLSPEVGITNPDTVIKGKEKASEL